MRQTLGCLFLFFLAALLAHAQQANAAGQITVPRLIRYSGVVQNPDGTPRTGTVGLTLSLYQDQQGGTPLWQEVQNVQLDVGGHYSVLLGSASPDGLPVELFSASATRWLGVQVQGEDEQPRVLLVSVPYALKASDAETLGGKPASAYALAAPSTADQTLDLSRPTRPIIVPSTLSVAAAGGGVSIFGSADGGQILSYDTQGSGSRPLLLQMNGGNVGIGIAPTAKLDVNGSLFVRADISLTGNLALPNTASSSIGVLTLGGARFLHNFGANNTFVGASAGNMSMDTGSATDNTAVGASALNADTTGADNSAFGSQALRNNTSYYNSAFGFQALQNNTTGGANNAFGTFALSANTTGGQNAAFGYQALSANTTGIYNSAFGFGALRSLTVGDHNIALGDDAGSTLSSGSSNIYIGSLGPGSLPGPESNTIRIGSDQTTTYLAGTVIGSFSATTATNFTGSLAGEVTGTQGATVVSDAVASNTPSAIVRRDGSGNFAAGTITLDGNLALPNTSSSSVGVVTLGGTPFLHNFGTNNTFVGASAGNMSVDLTGLANSAFGSYALQAITTGLANSAFGSSALQANTTGSDNAAFGSSALNANTTGNQNSAFGGTALAHNTTGGGNSAFGYAALAYNTTGGDNSAFGPAALVNLTSGDSNIAIGENAGNNLTSGGSNIYIGNRGVSSESNTIRIGSDQTATLIAGISGATSASGVAVYVNSSGQLGTVTSSRRFKHAIADMGGESDLLMKLRPVAFFYKPELDETQTRQYGLVAEEVALVAPQLVVYDKDGAPQTVRYHFVNAMLLNEVQKQHREIEHLGALQAQELYRLSQKKDDEIRHLEQEVEELRAEDRKIGDLTREVKELRGLVQQMAGEHSAAASAAK